MLYLNTTPHGSLKKSIHTAPDPRPLSSLILYSLFLFINSLDSPLPPFRPPPSLRPSLTPPSPPDIRLALKTDIHYELPGNYMRGAGDTYFSGKMLSKLARIIIIAKEVGGVDRMDFNMALNRSVNNWCHSSRVVILVSK